MRVELLRDRAAEQISETVIQTFVVLGVFVVKKGFSLCATEEAKALPDLPYVCLRVPTGGGKTVMAAHAVGVTAEVFLQADQCLVLWLAATTALKPAALATDTVIVVSTMQAPRVGDKEGRKIYAEDNGALMDHFNHLNAEQLSLLDKTEAGKPAYSLANVFKLHRPLIIVDEAHNARTPLSFETLARFNPACIVEFTATPRADSNVLTAVSAAQLKAEEMIKLPIRLCALRKRQRNWSYGLIEPSFNKHYYEKPASMNGEEAHCAALIDSLPEVEHWVRNLERDQYSFWLQTATDKFYPDFVVKLKDGRFLVIEYKGAHLMNEDTSEKDTLGAVWAARSNGLCLFRLVTKNTMDNEIRKIVKPINNN